MRAEAGGSQVELHVILYFHTGMDYIINSLTFIGLSDTIMLIVSCGCYRNERAAETGQLRAKHNLSYKPEYFIWHNMIDRCYNTSNPRYHRYGERGIIVCDRWLGENGVSNFYEDLGPRPSSDYTIEREDNDGNYEPDNCRWATRAEQNRNNSRNQLLTFNGKTLCIADWVEETGITRAAIVKRLKLGWSVERTLTTPVNPNYQH